MPYSNVNRSAPGAGSIRQKIVERNGRTYIYWEARYTAGTDPKTGKQIQRSVYGKTQKGDYVLYENDLPDTYNE